MTTLTYDDAAHLLMRAGFGELQAVVDKKILGKFDSREALADALVDYKGGGGRLKGKDMEDLQSRWLERMVKSKAPLEEKMILFWHSHFANGYDKSGVNNVTLAQQYGVFKNYAMSDFRTLCIEVSKTPAMIIYLDNDSNIASAPNENFAREVMELYTISVDGGYTENDVIEAARCFTGWTYDGDTRKKAWFRFNEENHDNGQKSFSAAFNNATINNHGMGDGLWLIDRLCNMRACGVFIAKKLWEYFGYQIENYDPQNPPQVINDLADVYTNSGRRIREVLRALFKHPEFFSNEALTNHVKSPVEYFVSMMRVLRAKVKRSALEDDVIPLMRSMGQELFLPPSVAGWPGHTAWVNTSSLLLRGRLANYVATGRGREVKMDPGMFAKRINAESFRSHAEAAVANFLRIMMVPEVSPEAEQALIEYLDTEEGPDNDTPGVMVPGSFVIDDKSPNSVDKLRGLVFLIASLPSYHLA